MLFVLLCLSHTHESPGHCRQCRGDDFLTIQRCHVTGWISEWNQTYHECDRGGQLCDASDLKTLAMFTILCIVFTTAAWMRRKHLLAQARF